MASHKLSKLKRPLEAFDESYVHDDKTSDISFIPFGRHRDFVIGYVPILISLFQDVDLFRSMGYTQPISVASETVCSHTCGELNVHLAVKGAHPEFTENERRVYLNKRRELLKVVCEPRKARLGFVMVALKDGSSTSAMTLNDLTSPMLCYRIRARFNADMLGTINYPRAMIEPVEHFDASQEMYERSIPISVSEYHKFFMISNNEGRGCLSNIPLLRNCAAKFEFLEMVTSTFPRADLAGVKREKKQDGDEATQQENGIVVIDPESMRVFQEYEAKLAEPTILPSETTEEMDALLLEQEADMMKEFEVDDDDEGNDYENDAELFGLYDEDDDDNNNNAVESAFEVEKPAKKPRLAAQISNAVSEKHIAENATSPPVQPVTTSTSTSSTAQTASQQARPISRALEVKNRFRQTVKDLRDEPLDDQIYRPISAYLTFRLYYEGALHRRSLQLLFQSDSAETRFNIATAKTLAWSPYQKYPKYVEEWSKKMHMQQGTSQSQIRVEDAIRAMRDFSSSRSNLVPGVRSKPTPSTPLGIKCMENLGEEYPHVLGHLYGSTKDEVVVRTKRAKNLIYGAASAGLMFAVEKYGLRRENDNGRVSDELVDQWRRVWAPLLPEKFWRVAVLIGFGPTLYYLFNGALDHAYLMAKGETPHQLIFALKIHRFFPKDPSKDIAPVAQRNNKRSASSSTSAGVDGMTPFLLSASVFDVDNSLTIEYQYWPNRMLRHFWSLSDDVKGRVLSTLAKAICDRRPEEYSNAVELAGVLKAAVSILVLFEILKPGELSDTMIANSFLFREQLELALFYPTVPNCALAVSEQLATVGLADRLQYLAKIDQEIGLLTHDESWRKAPPATLVCSAIAQKMGDYNANASLMRCLFDTPAFAKYGIDCVRSDSIEQLARLCVQRIEYLLFESDTPQMRFHCIFVDCADLYNKMYDIFAERVRKRQSPIWLLVCMFGDISVPRDKIFVMFEERCARLAARPDIIDVAKITKPFIYVPFADRLTTSDLSLLLLGLTTLDFVCLVEDDATADEKALLDVFTAPTASALSNEKAVRKADQSFAGGPFGDYLYLSGVAMWRGTLLGEQTSKPTVLEGLYFSVRAGEARQLPADLNMAQFDTNSRHRLRCWFDYRLASCFSQADSNRAIINAESGSLQAPVTIQFYEPLLQNRDRIRDAVQDRANVEQLLTGIPGVPRNVWLEGRTVADGVIVPGLLMRERSAILDRTIASRIGLTSRPAVLASAANCRFIAIDPIVGSAFAELENGYKVLLKRTCEYEKHRQLLLADSPNSGASASSATPLAVPSLAQMQSALSKTVTNWTGADAESRLEREFTDDMLMMNLHDNSRNHIRRMTTMTPNRRRLEIATDFVFQRHPFVHDMRNSPTRGFGINQLISIFNERPESVVVVGRLAETMRRSFSMRVRPMIENATAHELEIIANSPNNSLSLLDCYSLNSMSALPFMINVRLSKNRDPGCADCLFK